MQRPQWLLVRTLALALVADAGHGDRTAADSAATTCLTSAIVNGSRAGGDYANHQVVGAANASHGAELCRAACCADPHCDFWGLDVALPTAKKVMNCSHGQMCCWKKGNRAGQPSAQCPWGCYNGYTGRTPEPPPPPPPPPPPGPAVPSIETECALRQLALEYAMHLQPHRNHQLTHDALRLGAGCNRTFRPTLPATAAQPRQSPQVKADIVVHVALAGDDTTGDGSEQRPFATLHRARDAVRVQRSGVTATAHALSPAAEVVIGAGTHHLTTTLELGVADSRIRFVDCIDDDCIILQRWISY